MEDDLSGKRLSDVYEINLNNGNIEFVKDIREEYEIDLLERTFEFSVKVLQMLKALPYTKEYEVIRYQLAKCSTSVVANYEESQATNSKAEFKHKIGIVLREARESNYWLRLLKRLNTGGSGILDELVNEANELKKIFAAIHNKITSS